MSIFTFSNQLKVLAKTIKFASTVAFRIIRILRTSNKRLTRNYLNYSTKYIFSNSYLIINYSFENALFYHFKGISKTTQNTPLIINLALLNSPSITLVVHGIFKSKEYKIDVTPIWSFNTQSFKTQTSNLNINTSFTPTVELMPKKINLRQQPISIKQKKIQINQVSFNQNDFL